MLTIFNRSISGLDIMPRKQSDEKLVSRSKRSSWGLEECAVQVKYRRERILWDAQGTSMNGQREVPNNGTARIKGWMVVKPRSQKKKGDIEDLYERKCVYGKGRRDSHSQI